MGLVSGCCALLGFFRTSDLFAGVILLGVIGYVSALFVGWLESHLLVWRNRGSA